jgi:hypothetical protein
MNFRLQYNFNDAEPLTNVGFKLVAKSDTRQTQTYSADSRIDGFFVLGGDMIGIDFYDVTQIWKNKKVGRSYSDHAQIEFQFLSESTNNTSAKDGNATIEASADDSSSSSGSGSGGAANAIRLTDDAAATRSRSRKPTGFGRPLGVRGQTSTRKRRRS